MIPFLLHARLTEGGGSGGLIDPPGWNGVSFDASDYQLGSPASALASFTINSDGTWSTLSDAGPITGNWFGTPAPGVGAGYEVRFTVTSTFGAGTVVNQASTRVGLGSNRTFSLQVSRSTSGTSLANRTVLVEIWPVGGSVASTSSFTVSAVAEVGS